MILFLYLAHCASECYLSSMHMVRTAVAGFSRVLRRDGGVCIHMLASEDSPMGSCNVRIPKAFWKEDEKNVKGQFARTKIG